MYCSQCGAKLPDNAKFCYKCGAKIEIPEWEEAQQAPAEEAPQQPAIQWPDIPVLGQPVQPVEKKAEPEIRWPGMESAPQPVTETVPTAADYISEPAAGGADTAVAAEPAEVPVQEVPEDLPVPETPDETLPEQSMPYAEAGQEEAETVPVPETEEYEEPAPVGVAEVYGYTDTAAEEEQEEVPGEEAASEETDEVTPYADVPETYVTAADELPAQEPSQEPAEPYTAYAEQYVSEEPAVSADMSEESDETAPYAEVPETDVAAGDELPAEEPAQETAQRYEAYAEQYAAEVTQEETEGPAEEETQPEEIFEPVEVPEDTQQTDDYSGFRIVEKAVQLPQNGYVFSHADDLARAASDALSQFDILTDQELLNVETPAAETLRAYAEETQSEEETVQEETAPEEPSAQEIPAEEPAAEEIPAEEPVSAETEETQTYTETEEWHEYAEVPAEEPSAETELSDPGSWEETETRTETPEEPAEEEQGPETEYEVFETPETEEIPAADTAAVEEEVISGDVQEKTSEDALVEDFIPSQLISEEILETEETEEDTRLVPEEDNAPAAEETADAEQQEIPGAEKQGDVPISFEEFRFYTRREIEEEKAAYEQQKAEEGEPVQEEGESYFSFEREQRPEQEEEIPEIMYGQEAQEEAPVPVQETAEEQPEEAEGVTAEAVMEEVPEDRTVSPEEETAEEIPAAETVTEETPSEELPAEEIPSEEKPAADDKTEVPAEKSGKKTVKKSSHKNSAESSEDEKKKKENRNRLISLIAALVVLAAAALGGWYWYNLPDNVYSRYMSGALKAVEQGDVYTAAVDFNEALKVRPESLQASEQLDRLYSETHSLTYEYMDKQMFSEAHDQAKLLSAIHPDEAENNTAILKDVFMEWAAASTRTGNDQDIQHVLDMASAELSRENYTDVENSARAAKAGYEYADFFMSNGEKLLELNSGNDRAAVFAQLDGMIPQIKEYAGKSGFFPVRTGTDSQGREAAIYYTADSLLQLYIGKFDSAGNRTGDAFSYIITTAADGSREYGSYSAAWNSDRPNGSVDYHDFAGNYAGTERTIVRGSTANGYYDGSVSMVASDGYTYGVSFTSGAVKVLADTAPDGQKNVIGYAADGERWLCWTDDQVSRLQGPPYAEG